MVYKHYLLQMEWRQKHLPEVTWGRVILEDTHTRLNQNWTEIRKGGIVFVIDRYIIFVYHLASPLTYFKGTDALEKVLNKGTYPVANFLYLFMTFCVPLAFTVYHLRVCSVLVVIFWPHQATEMTADLLTVSAINIQVLNNDRIGLEFVWPNDHIRTILTFTEKKNAAIS